MHVQTVIEKKVKSLSSYWFICKSATSSIANIVLHYRATKLLEKRCSKIWLDLM